MDIYEFLNKEYEVPYKYKILNRFDLLDSSNIKHFGKPVATKIFVVDKKTGKPYVMAEEIETSTGKKTFNATLSGLVFNVLPYSEDLFITKKEEEELKVYVKRWIDKLGLSKDENYCRLVNLFNMPIFVRAFIKKAPAENLKSWFYINCFFVIFDDSIEEIEYIRDKKNNDQNLQYYLKQVDKYRDRLLDLMRLQSEKIIEELKQPNLLEQLRELDKKFGTNFAKAHPHLLEFIDIYKKENLPKCIWKSIVDYLEATKTKWSPLQKIEHFLEERLDDIGTLFILEMTRHVECITVKEELKQNKLFQDFEKLAMLHSLILHDIISLPKEILLNRFKRNYVLHKAGLLSGDPIYSNPLQEAINQAFNDLNTLRYIILQLRDDILIKLGNEISPILNHCIRCCTNAILIWCGHQNTERYNSNTKDYKENEYRINYEHFFIEYIKK